MGMTSDITTLRKNWMKLYLNLNILKTHDLRAKAILEPYKEKLVEFHMETMEFFDALESPI